MVTMLQHQGEFMKELAKNTQAENEIDNNIITTTDEGEGDEIENVSNAFQNTDSIPNEISPKKEPKRPRESHAENDFNLQLVDDIPTISNADATMAALTNLKKKQKTQESAEEELLDVEDFAEDQQELQEQHQQQEQQKHQEQHQQQAGVSEFSDVANGKVSLVSEKREEEGLIQENEDDVEIEEDESETQNVTLDISFPSVPKTEAMESQSIIEVPDGESKSKDVLGWSSLAAELLFRIFSFRDMTSRHLCHCALVCKEWKAIVDTPSFWSLVCRNSWTLGDCKSTDFSSEFYNWKEVTKQRSSLVKRFSLEAIESRIEISYKSMEKLISHRVPGSEGPVDQLSQHVSLLQQLVEAKKHIQVFEKSVSVPCLQLSLMENPYTEELLFLFNNIFFTEIGSNSWECSIIAKDGSIVQLFVQAASQSHLQSYQLSYFSTTTRQHETVFRFSNQSFDVFQTNLEHLKDNLRLTQVSESSLLFFIWRYCVPYAFTEEIGTKVCERYSWNIENMDIFAVQPMTSNNEEEIKEVATSTATAASTTIALPEEPEEDVDIL